MNYPTTVIDLDSSDNMVIYHDPCSDGFCAAWLLHYVFPNAKFIPAKYGDNPPDVAGKNVWIVDFSYPRETLERMSKAAVFLLVLDHHKTAQADCEGLDYCVFDMNKSGARLTWEYLLRNTAMFDRLPPHLPNHLGPWLVEYTEDRDLWRHELVATQAINAAIRSYPLNFGAWHNTLNTPERL